MTQTILRIDELESDPNIQNGRPIIKGTAITVSEIVLLHRVGEQMSPEQIAEYLYLCLGQVYIALSYYYLHQAEIDEQILRDAEDTERCNK